MKQALICITSALAAISLSACGIWTISENHTQTEEFPVELTCNLSYSGITQVNSVELQGDYDRNTTSLNPYQTTVPGYFGNSVELYSENLNHSKIIFHYQPEDMNNVPEKNLILLHYNENESDFETISSELDTEQHTVSAEITEQGVYLLADAYEWYKASGIDASEYAHDTLYKNSEYGFEILLPEEIPFQYDVTNYPLENDSEGKSKALLKCEQNAEIQCMIEYVERPYYDSAESFMKNLSEQLGKESEILEKGAVDSETKGFYLHTVYENTHLWYSVFPLTDKNYIFMWFSSTEENHQEKIMQSIQSFRFTNSTETYTAQKNYSNSGIKDEEDEEEFDDYKYINGREISIKLPDNLKTQVVDEGWAYTYQDSKKISVFTPLLKVSQKEYPEYVQDISIILEDSRKNSRQAAQNAASAFVSSGEGKILTTEEVDLNGQNGYLFSVHIPEKSCYQLYGFYEIPEVHQYVKVTFTLQDSVPEKNYQAYWDCLKTVNTDDSDQLITAENLSITFPENFYAYPAKIGNSWWLESNSSGNDYYRLWLLETDHQKCREAGNDDYSAAFFYLLDTGRPAAEDAQKEEEKFFNYAENGRVDRREEITLSNGQKGYLLCFRDEPELEAFNSTKLYGFYELTEKNGELSNQYVRIEFQLNEPLSQEVYDAYWNCLKSVDIHQ